MLFPLFFISLPVFTVSAIQALVLFEKLHPGHRKEEIENFIKNAVQFLQDKLNSDGSWFGNWGVCFTYGTWFGLGGLAVAGKTYYNCPAMRKGVDFLLKLQRDNGGWGESYLSYPKKNITSQLWDTGFAIQALLDSNLIDEITPILAKGHDFIKKSQVRDNPSGDFKSMHRHISKGLWTFAVQDHGWQVSDCTAEALKCCLLFSLMPPEIVGEKMEPERLYDSVKD